MTDSTSGQRRGSSPVAAFLAAALLLAGGAIYMATRQAVSGENAATAPLSADAADKADQAAPRRPAGPIELNAEERRLLALLARYQKDFSLEYLIVLRTSGQLAFDDEKYDRSDYNLVRDFYGGIDESKAKQFDELLWNLPEEFVTIKHEPRYGNPFIVSVTPEGLDYLAKH
jgi:hypothetical protein